MAIITAGITKTQEAAPPLSWSLNKMLFDAWLYLGHNNSLTITQHPVETGAAITDHSYVNPKRWSFNIGMTDVVSNPPVTGQSQSRSVNAYNELVRMQSTREPLQLVSKYGVYENVLIVDLSAADNFQTKYAGRFTITLQEIIMVGNQVKKVSSNPQATDKTNKGQVPPQPIDQTIKNALTNMGVSANKLIQFGIQELFNLLPKLPLAQVQAIWSTLVNLNPQALINLGLSELQQLFPSLSSREAQTLLSFLQTQIQKQLNK